MQNMITVKEENRKLSFYLQMKGKQYWLFDQRYCSGVYDYFKNGRREKEVIEFSKWKKNHRLSKTIETISVYTKYIKKEFA